MPLKVGVVGSSWAARIHAPGVAGSSNAELVGLWSRSSDKAAAAAQTIGCRTFDTYAQLLDDVDAVTIAVPPEFQVGLALAAVERGKHLILEKPMAADSTNASKLVEAVQRKGVAALVYFTRYFTPSIRRKMERLRQSSWTNATAVIHAQVIGTESPFALAAWRNQERAALWDLAPHTLSVLCYVLGPVQCVTSVDSEPRFVEFLTDHSGGARGRVSVSLDAIGEEKNDVFLFSDAREQVRLPPPFFSRSDLFTNAVDDLASMVQTGNRSHPVSVHFGLEVTRVLEAVEHSRLTKTAVTLA